MYLTGLLKTTDYFKKGAFRSLNVAKLSCIMSLKSQVETQTELSCSDSGQWLICYNIKILQNLSLNEYILDTFEKNDNIHKINKKNGKFWQFKKVKLGGV